CDGTWQQASIPGGGMLLGTAALDASNAWAAGQDGNGKMEILRWDGASWKVLWTGPNGALYNVRVTSPSDVWASGRGDPGAVAIHWDGNRGTVMPLGVSAGVNISIFMEMAALSPVNVWGAGLFTNHDEAFIAHWDGSTWQVTN